MARGWCAMKLRRRGRWTCGSLAGDVAAGQHGGPCLQDSGVDLGRREPVRDPHNIEGTPGVTRVRWGWSQIKTLPSDAYATGQALVALKEAHAIPIDSSAYRRGVQYLTKRRPHLVWHRIAKDDNGKHSAAVPGLRGVRLHWNAVSDVDADTYSPHWPVITRRSGLRRHHQIHESATSRQLDF
jgi:hypothetical protein